MFENFRIEEVRSVYADVLTTGNAEFSDPRWPYLLTIKKVGEAYELKIEDTRKRWWGRTVEKKATTSKPSQGSSMQGPAWEALMILDRVIEADKR